LISLFLCFETAKQKFRSSHWLKACYLLVAISHDFTPKKSFGSLTKNNFLVFLVETNKRLFFVKNRINCCIWNDKKTFDFAQIKVYINVKKNSKLHFANSRLKADGLFLTNLLTKVPKFWYFLNVFNLVYTLLINQSKDQVWNFIRGQNPMILCTL
jgi:hypothetical protein